ncbi:family 20 glycosylhydrolase [Halosquirtibacter laminarini]|uniref:Family 20 glycosylhydrolase n=1 Tax=Halosquirtibacter laminarini TaxID=3374600 RepID=A0AC61NHR5_9BACT|nr:family 20 glycosylhydrolase [Prolixibacteraceae bacterium]
MKKLFLLSTLLCCSLFIYAQQYPGVIPTPQSCSFVHVVKPLSLENYCFINESDQKLDPLFTVFAQEMTDVANAKVSKKGTEIIFRSAKDEQLKEGAYNLTVGKQVIIESDSYEGFLYGSRSLLQLLSSNSNHHQVPQGTIIDAPAYGKRCLMIDVARKFVPMNELKDYIRTMAWFKMNELHLHLSDNSWGGYPAYRLPSEKYPELTSKDGHYSWEEIRDLQDFAKIYAITITPEIDAPGHSLAFTQIRPDLKSPLIGEKYLDILNPNTIPFVQSIIDEVLPHFDAPDFHIGTDEYRIHAIKDKELRTKIGEAFRNYINTMSAYVQSKGKGCRIWSGYEHMPGETEVSNKTIIDMWETSDAKNKLDQGYTFLNSSHYYTYIVPGAPYYGVSDPFVYNTWSPLMFGPKSESILDHNTPQLLGGKLHVWNDFGPTGYTTEEIARLTLPSLAVFSQKLWGTSATHTYKNFCVLRDELLDIPESHLMDREKQAPRLVVASSKVTLDGKGAKQMAKDAKNITYPWTLEMEIYPTTSSLDSTTILSSRLAGLYTNLKHTYKVKKKKVEKEGIALVRANQNYFHHPLDSHRPDVLVFEYKIQPNKWNKIKVVGERKKTTLYVDGKEIGTYRIQTVCPVEKFGSDVQQSFTGNLKNVKVYNYVK